jgi:hypothetical protein
MPRRASLWSKKTRPSQPSRPPVRRTSRESLVDVLTMSNSADPSGIDSPGERRALEAVGRSAPNTVTSLRVVGSPALSERHPSCREESAGSQAQRRFRRRCSRGPRPVRLEALPTGPARPRPAEDRRSRPLGSHGSSGNPPSCARLGPTPSRPAVAEPPGPSWARGRQWWPVAWPSFRQVESQCSPRPGDAIFPRRACPGPAR